MTFVGTDILNPYKRNIISIDRYNTLIDFLVEHYPNGFKRPTDISVNGYEIALANYDIALNEDDVIVLLDRAALPVGLIGGWFVTALANLAISVTLSYVANRLFAPDAPDIQGTPSSVYNLNSAQNMARYGSPIPIIYGKVRMFPSMIAQPLYRYEGNVEYLYHVLCVGQGRNTTDKVLISNDEITSAGDLEWKLLYKEDFYNIPLKGLGYHITNTLTTPSNMLLSNDTSSDAYGESEKYLISKDASSIEIDYVYPRGLSWVKGDGSYTSTYTAFVYRIYQYDGTNYYEVDAGLISANAYSINAIQRTKTLDTSGYSEDIYISFQKTYGANDSRTTNETYIKRVKEIFPNEDFTQRYGDITLLVCKIKATNAISSAGQLKVNGYFSRTDVGNTMAEVLTDLYTNTTYGAGLSADNLNFTATEETVNCAYDTNMTVFDAMRKPALAQGYSLYLAGMDVILKKDGANPITTAMYNEMNIIRNSFKAQYLFKEEYPAYDGFKCTYIDGCGWVQRSETYPSTSTRPKVVDLFGVVDYRICNSPYHRLDITVSSPTIISSSNVSYGGTVTVDDNGDGTYHIWSDDESSYFKFAGVTRPMTSVIIHRLVVSNATAMFLDCVDLESINLDGMDTRSLTNCYQMFQNCSSLSSIDLYVFADATGITNTAQMFYGCSLLTSLNLRPLDMSGVTYLPYMFYGCANLVCITNVDTTGSTLLMTGMFDGCTSLVAPDAATQTALTDFSSGGLNWVNPSPCP